MDMFTKRPGEFPTLDNENAFLVGDPTPEVIKLPPELGGQTVKVDARGHAKCPVHDHDVVTYRLANGIYVAECDKFYWYRRDDA